MSRCPLGFRLDIKDYRIALPLCDVGLVWGTWRSLEELGLVTLKGYGTPPHTYLVALTDAGEHALQELEHA